MNTRHPVILAIALLFACSSPPTAPSSPTRIELVSGGGQQGVAGYPLPEPVVVRVVDERGNPVSGVELAANITAPLARVQSDNWISDNEGRVTLRWRMGASHDGETIAISAKGSTPVDHLIISANGGSRPVRKIVGGLDRYCIITLDERLGCWQALEEESVFPRPPEQIPSITYRPVGELHRDIAMGAPGAFGGPVGCALGSDGSISCFDDEHGLASLTGIGGEDGFRRIYANHLEVSRFFCALKDDGEAWCWGGNSDGQLGDGTTDDAALPRRVDTGAQFTALALGDHYACGLDIEGAAWCWGSNAAGATGTGMFDGNSMVPTPVATQLRFTTLTSVAGVATCGVTHLGAWWCWGAGLFSGFDAPSAEPQQAILPQGTRLAAPDQIALISDPAGAAAWWGDLYPTLDLTIATEPRSVTIPFAVSRFAPGVKDRAVCTNAGGQGRWLCIDLLWLWYGNPSDESGSIGARPLVHGVP